MAGRAFILNNNMNSTSKYRTTNPKEPQPRRSPITNTSTVLVVGASRGIGLEFTRQCLDTGARVIATERNSDTSQLGEINNSKNNLRIETLDVSDPESCRRFGTRLVNECITHVVHNAGVMESAVNFGFTNSDDLHTVKKKMQTTFATNTVGPLMVLIAILPFLKATAIWAVVGSRFGSVDENWFGGQYAFRASKAALNMLAKNVLIDLKNRVGVVVLHPGLVGKNGDGTVAISKSVAGMLNAIQATSINSELRFVAWDGELLRW